MTEHEARKARQEHFKRLPQAKRVCLRCQNLVPRFRIHQGCCQGCVNEMVEYELFDDPWAFLVNWDLVEAVA